MDSAFLARHRVMDYSLLLGVHRSQFLRTRASKWPVPVVRMTKTHGDIAYGYEGTSVSEHSVRAPRDSVASIMSSQPSQGSRAARLSGDGDDLTAHIGLLHGRARAQLMEGPTKFYFGIIDILQRWNSSKRSERIAKKLFCCVVGQVCVVLWIGAHVCRRLHRACVPERVVTAFRAHPSARHCPRRNLARTSTDSIGS